MVLERLCVPDVAGQDVEGLMACVTACIFQTVAADAAAVVTNPARRLWPLNSAAS
jgi:hypothetical protein